MDTVSSPEEMYKFLRESKIKILDNMVFSGSPGHQIAELDYFLRKYRCGDIPRDARYLWIQKKVPICSALVEVYGDHFRQFNLGMLVHDLTCSLAAQITRMVPEFGIDVGLSHFKNSVHSRADTYVNSIGGSIYYNVTNAAVVQATMDYYRTRNLTEDFHLWSEARPPIDEPLADLLGGNIDRLAVIHLRRSPGNAGLVVPPENFSPSFEYLRDMGFTIVKIGTEPYPAEFSRYGVVNYSESPLRSFKNDLALMGGAKLGLINASGLEHIADVMDVPTVSFGRWHLTVTPYSRKVVVVPSLLFDPVRDRTLSFPEQMLFFKTRGEFWEGTHFGWHFPAYRFTPRAPQGDELRAATQEALELSDSAPPLSPYQLRFNRLDENGPLSICRSRISQFFLERFAALL